MAERRPIEFDPKAEAKRRRPKGERYPLVLPILRTVRPDAVAEGLCFVADGAARFGIPGMAHTWDSDPRKGYRALWESINGAGSWDANPWVWALNVQPQHWSMG